MNNLKNINNWLKYNCKFAQNAVLDTKTEKQTKYDIHGPNSLEGKILSELFTYNENYDETSDPGENEDFHNGVHRELIDIYDLEQLHELHYKINELNDLQSNNKFSPLIKQKVDKIVSEMIVKFNSISSNVLEQIIKTYSSWIFIHSPSTRGKFFINNAIMYAKTYDTNYFPLLTLPDFARVEVQKQAAKIITPSIKWDLVIDKLKNKEIYIKFLFGSMDSEIEKTKISYFILSRMTPAWYKVFPDLLNMALPKSINNINKHEYDSLIKKYPDNIMIEKITKKALDMLKSCGDDINKVMSAISYALNVQHNTGAMTEYLNIGESELDDLTAHLKSQEPIWSKEIQELLQPQTYQEMLGRGGQKDPYDTNNGFSSYSYKNNIKVIMKF